MSYRDDFNNKRHKGGGYRERDRSAARESGRRGGRGGRGRREIVCYGCNQPGHHIRDCPTKSKGGGDREFRRGQKRRGEDDYDRVGGSEINNNDDKEDDAAFENRLKGLISRIGEKSKDSLENNLDKLAEALNDDLPRHRDFIIDTLLMCVKCLNVKTSIYGTLVGLINCRSPSVGQQIISRLHSDLMKALETHNHMDTRLLVRFSGCLALAGVISLQSFLDLLHLFIREIEVEELEQRHSDALLYTVLSALPWTGLELSAAHDPSSKPQDTFNSLMDRIQHLMQSRHQDRFELARVFIAEKKDSESGSKSPSSKRGDDEDGDDEQKSSEDLLLVLWNAILQLQKDEWKTKFIIRPHTHFKDRFAEEGKQHKFALDKLPPQSSGPSARLRPNIRVFPQNLPLIANVERELRPIDRFIITEFISDIIILFDGVRKEGTKELLSIPMGDLDPDIDYHPLIVETAFSQLFSLPSSPCYPVYYGALFCDLFKALPKTIPPIVGQAVNHIFNRLDSLDIEDRDRFANWLSFHLSNFSFTWPWQGWEWVTKLERTAPKRIFVQEVLERCVRLAYWDKIKSTIPDSYTPLMPDQPAPAFRWAAKDESEEREKKKDDEEASSQGKDKDGKDKDKTAEDDEEAQYIKLASELLHVFKSRMDSVSLLQWMDKHVTPTLGADARLRLLLPTLLFAGSKSFTHIVALLERYREVISKLNMEENSQLIIVNLVCEFWQHSNQHVIVLLDKLLSMRIVDTTSVIHWIFSQKDVAHRSFIWDILWNCVDKTLRRLAMATRLHQNKHGSSSKSKDDTAGVIEALEKEKKEMFLGIFHNFETLLSDLSDGEAGMFDLVLGRFVQFVRKFHWAFADYRTELETSVFTSDVDKNITDAFKLSKHL